MGRYKTKLQAIQEANKRILGEQGYTAYLDPNQFSDYKFKLKQFRK